MTLDKELRIARANKGWSQKELAQRAKVSTCTISFIECGLPRKPRFDILVKLERALEVESETFTKYLE